MIRKRKRVRLPWKPVHQPSRRERLAAEYPERRKAVREAAFELDKHRCIFCHKRLDLDAAHEHEIVWRSKQGDPLDIDNVVTLCAKCHGDIHPRVGGLRKRIEGSRSTGIRRFEKVDDSWQELAA